MAIITYIRSGKINVKWQKGKSNEFNVNTKIPLIDDLLSKEGRVSSKHPQSASINATLVALRHDMETAEAHLVAANRQLLKDDVKAEYERIKKEREEQEAKIRHHNEVRVPALIEMANDIAPDLTAEIKQIEAQIEELQSFLAIKRAERKKFEEDWNLPISDTVDVDTLMCTYLDRYIATKVKTRSNAAIFTSLKNHLLSYNEELTISEMDKTHMYAIEKHLWDKRNQLNSSIKGYMQKIKTLLKWFSDETFINPSYSKYKFELKETKVDVVYFSKEELKQIEELQVRTKGQQRCKDLMLLMSATGLRMSDTQFSFNSIQQNAKGRYELNVVTQKTNQHCVIELNPLALRLIESFKQDGGVPTFTSKYFNTCVRGILKAIPSLNKEVTTFIQYSGPNPIKHKSLGTDAKKGEKPKRLDLVGSHTGRRTFINLSLQSGMGREKLKQMTGHTTNKNLEGYVNAADDATGSFAQTFA